MPEPLVLYNTLTRSKEEFTPLKQDRVALYTCGPTVYHYAHIGNLRTFVFYDLLRRTLGLLGYDVSHVMNITDVGHLTDDADSGEDKMEKGAAREGKSVWEVAEFYTDAFYADAKALNIMPATTKVRATEEIEAMIGLVQVLEEKGFTYPISDGIYFDTAKFPAYGKLAQLDLAGLQEGARVEKNAEKRNPSDFALWKFSPAGEGAAKRQMEWDSPWGVGFPGWHIECSAMAMKYLGKTLDIHAGGVDHIPVHHSNEIAQSEAATGVPFSRFWVHSEFLLVDGGKMAKSEGNFYTLSDLATRGYDPLAFRYLLLGAHYRSKLNFTLPALDGAASAYGKLVYLAAGWEAPRVGCAEFEERFRAAVADDLNTPQALAVMWEMVKSDQPSHAKAETLIMMDRVLGLSLEQRAAALRKQIAGAGKKMQKLLEKRSAARAEKDFAKADALRDKILGLGFIVEDTDDGPILRPVAR